MNNPPDNAFARPTTLREVAEQSDSLEAFGYNLRDWQHEIARRVTSRAQIATAIRDTPPELTLRFDKGQIADAYLAAYAEWIAQEAKLENPAWTKQPKRSLPIPWYSSSNHEQLQTLAPESFRSRGLFTVPENPFKPKPGRPRVSAETKRQKSIHRQRAYRQRVKSILEQARAIGIR